MAAYGWIVRKFIRYGEVIPQHFTGQSVQSLVVGTSSALDISNATADVSVVLSIPNNPAVASTVHTITLPYKVRVLPDTIIVPSATTASNVTITVGKSAPTAGATVIQPTAAAVNTDKTPRTIATHDTAAETINPLAADPESLTITVLKADAANVAPFRIYLQLAKAD
jgi:hypothetical protein